MYKKLFKGICMVLLINGFWGLFAMVMHLTGVLPVSPVQLLLDTVDSMLAIALAFQGLIALTVRDQAPVCVKLAAVNMGLAVAESLVSVTDGWPAVGAAALPVTAAAMAAAPGILLLYMLSAKKLSA